MQSKLAYILNIDTDKSQEYARTCAESCDKVKQQYVFVKGYQEPLTARRAWVETGIKLAFTEKDIISETRVSKGDLCSAGHAKIWKMIANGQHDVGIVLEHDAIMLHSLDRFTIPDNAIVTLGYKLTDPNKYLHEMAGPPSELVDIKGHEGAHAYAITKTTAQNMIMEIERSGRPLGCIDNAYFIRNQRKTSFPLKMAMPTPAIGWLRESTIWGKSSTRNEPFHPRFKDFLQH